MHQAIQELNASHGYTISALCKVSDITRPAYYKYQRHHDRRTVKEATDRQLIQTIANIYLDTDGTYGYRQMHNAVNTTPNAQYNHKRIYRLMRWIGLRSVTRIKTQQYVKHSAEYVSENILVRDFVAPAVNKKWLTDITEFKTMNGKKIYLCAIIDLFDNKIVAYHFSQKQTTQLMLKTLKLAILKHPGATPLVHSDRGVQYTSHGFKALLEVSNMQQSMSRPGKCIDNGPMESLWGKIKSERYHLKRQYDYDTSLQCIVDDISRYIEFYNYDRPQSILHGLSPHAFQFTGKVKIIRPRKRKSS